MFLPLHHFAFIFVWLPARRISGFVARRLVVSSFTAAAAFLAHHHKKAKLKRAAKQAAKKAAEQAKQTAWPAAWWPAAPPPMMAAHALPIAPVAAPEPHDWRVWLACLVPLLVRRLTELRAALLSAPATLGLPSLTVPSSISAHLPRLRLTEAFSSFSARPAVAAICILGLGCLALERLAVRNQRRARPQPAALASPSTPAEAPTEKAADFSDRATDTSEDALQWSPAAPTPQHEAGSAPLDSADDDETPIWLRQAESELHTPASLGQTHDQMRVYHDPPPTPMGEPRAPTEPSPMLFSHSTSENPLPVESHFLRRALAARNPNHDGLTFVRRKKGIFSGGDPAPNASPTSAGGQRSPGGATPTTPSTPDGKEAGAVSAHDQHDPVQAAQAVAHIAIAASRIAAIAASRGTGLTPAARAKLAPEELAGRLRGISPFANTELASPPPPLLSSLDLAGSTALLHPTAIRSPAAIRHLPGCSSALSVAGDATRHARSAPQSPLSRSPSDLSSPGFGSPTFRHGELRSWFATGRF